MTVSAAAAAVVIAAVDVAVAVVAARGIKNARAAAGSSIAGTNKQIGCECK